MLAQILQPAASTSTQTCDLECLARSAGFNSAGGNVNLNADLQPAAPSTQRFVPILQLATSTSTQICQPVPILQPAMSTSTQIHHPGCLEHGARANSAAGNVDLNAAPPTWTLRTQFSCHHGTWACCNPNDIYGTTPNMCLLISAQR